MPIPSHCPNCQASLPESLERFGANYACTACGQVLRIDEPFPEEEVSPSHVHRAEEDDADAWEIDSELPPIDQLLSEGWEIFKANLGLCVGVAVLAGLLNLVAQSPELAWTYHFKVRVADPAKNALIEFGVNIYSLFQVAFSIWISAGFTHFMLQLVRGNPVGVGDLFRGGKFFWRALLCSLIIFFAVLAAMFLCGVVPAAIMFPMLGPLSIFAGGLIGVVPCVILILVYSQYMYVLVDRDSPGLNALGESVELTRGKKLSLLALFVVCTIINLFGFLAIIVGAFFTSAFTSIVMALAYDRICGRPRRRLPEDDDDETEG